MEISQTEFSPFAIIFRYLFVIFVIIGRGVKKGRIFYGQAERGGGGKRLQSAWL